MSEHRKSRKWCWTLAARNDAEADDWCLNAAPDHLPIPFPDGVEYCIYQVECSESNLIHLQGFSYYKNAVSFRRAKLDISKRAHVESARGTVEECVRYCSKWDTAVQGPFEYGKAPTQGRRTDWHDAREIVCSGGTDREVMDLHPNLAPNWRGIEKMREIYQEHPLRRDMTCVYLWGDTNVGKTHRARMNYPEAYFVRGKYVEGKLFDNYKGEEVLILDEWKHDEWPLTAMNAILDPFGYWITCRYANRWTCWKLVIITANYDPTDAYFGHACAATFLRRITVKLHVNDKFEELPF